MTRFYKTLYILLAWIVRIIFNVKVVGRENDPRVEDGPFIICANHISATDPIAMASAMRKPLWVTNMFTSIWCRTITA